MTPTTLTTELVAELRRLMDNRAKDPTLPISYTLKIEAVNALPALLAAAEREAKMREALENMVSLFASQNRDCEEWLKYREAMAALAEGGGK
jgi:hypothetical protein